MYYHHSMCRLHTYIYLCQAKESHLYWIYHHYYSDYYLKIFFIRAIDVMVVHYIYTRYTYITMIMIRLQSHTWEVTRQRIESNNINLYSGILMYKYVYILFMFIKIILFLLPKKSKYTRIYTYISNRKPTLFLVPRFTRDFPCEMILIKFDIIFRTCFLWRNTAKLCS